MLKLMGGLIKAALFAILVLVVGATVHIGDRTISDQIKLKIAHAERSAPVQKAQAVVEDLGDEARDGVVEASRAITRKLTEKNRPSKRSEIPSTERKELKKVLDSSY